jgi:UDP-N-acetylmuramate: L-alanyl-gamma-D-glutamyl-meso-diaminopimelate ligase
VSLKVPEPHDKVPETERLDVPALVDALRASGVPASAELEVEGLVREVVADARAGDVLLVMSNGAFGGFLERTLAALAPSPRATAEA